MSIFCKIEDDLLELCYSDTAANYLRRYEERDEFDQALEERKEEEGEAPFEEDRNLEENLEEEDKSDNFNFEE